MDRTEYIGSSDARDILAGNFDRLWMEKTGRAVRPDIGHKWSVQLGRVTEDTHLDWTMTALDAERGGEWKWSKAQASGAQHFASLTLPGGAVLGSHPDALLHHVSGFCPVEVKLTGRFEPEEAADFYMPQLQHHMICWDKPRILLSVAGISEEPVRLWIGFSQSWADTYAERCAEFWRHLTEDVRPGGPRPFDNGEEGLIVPRAVRDSVPVNGRRRRCIDGDNRALALIDDYLGTKDAAQRHERAKKDLKALMSDEEGELYCTRLTLKRDARGAIRITEPKAARTAA